MASGAVASLWTHLTPPTPLLHLCSLRRWEVVSGQRPFAGMSSLAVVFHATQHGRRPDIPAQCPPALADLMQRCWDADPLQRWVGFANNMLCLAAS